MLDFDVGYFEEEIRYGFTIPAFMKHAWASELEMLNKIDTICRENDIKYYANWGTLLGAVRHKGIIPWDDDIDLCMFREDINRFSEAIRNYDGIMMLDIFNSPDHGARANRVVNDARFSMKRETYKDYYGFPFPVGVDIFPIDYVPRDKGLEEELVEALQVCSTASHERVWLDEHDPIKDKDYVKNIMEYQAAVKWLETNCNMKFSQENPTDQEILILCQEIMGMYGEADADYITEMHSLASGNSYYIPKEVFDNDIRLPFENTTIPVPIGYDEILKLKYGSDYMMPKNIAAGHDYPFYDRLIKAMYDEKKYETLEDFSEYIQDISSRYYVSFVNKTTDTVLDFDEKTLSGATSKVAALCEVLEEFKRLCDIAGIKYYAINETLLSTSSGEYSRVIDKGIEVAIHRTDLPAFLDVLPRNLGAWYSYSTLFSHDDHHDIRMLIWSDDYKCEPDEFAKRFHGCRERVYLYISIIDGVAEDEEREKVRQVLIKNLFVTSQSMPTSPPYTEDILSIVKEWEGILDVNMDLNSDLKCCFLRNADRMSGNASGEGHSKVRLNSDYQDAIDAIYDVSDFSDSKSVSFGITSIDVPNG